jgi:GDP/UDP-N,N'-diacetylbacillosamine 2-epimerase (hydrolysing)
MPNSDKDNKIIGKMIDGYINRDSGRAKSFISLGQLRYLSVIKNVDIVLGNSSSGLTEVPVFNKPTVNIGARQKGRLRASSIIDCEENVKSLSLAIDKALSEDFQKSLGDIDHPYKSGNASKAISKTLKNFNLDGVLIKKFYNLKP